MTWKKVSGWLDSTGAATVIAVAALIGYCVVEEQSLKAWLLGVALVAISIRVASVVAIFIGDFIVERTRKKNG